MTRNTMMNTYKTKVEVQRFWNASNEFYESILRELQ